MTPGSFSVLHPEGLVGTLPQFPLYLILSYRRMQEILSAVGGVPCTPLGQFTTLPVRQNLLADGGRTDCLSAVPCSSFFSIQTLSNRFHHTNVPEQLSVGLSCIIK